MKLLHCISLHASAINANSCVILKYNRQFSKMHLISSSNSQNLVESALYASKVINIFRSICVPPKKLSRGEMGVFYSVERGPHPVKNRQKRFLQKPIKFDTLAEVGFFANNQSRSPKINRIKECKSFLA